MCSPRLPLRIRPPLRKILRPPKGLDPRPAAGSPALSGALDIGNDYFVKTSYVGAFGENNWLLGWTALDQIGYLSDMTTGVELELIEEIPNKFDSFAPGRLK